MKIIKANNLACPIDGKKLKQIDKQFVCENGHSFDIARQGYVNLLPVQHKRSKQPGDSKAMVLARSHFLNSGIYQPIAEKLTQIVATHIIDDNDVCLLDAGCGEGYYFDFLCAQLNQKPELNKLCFIGMDISKDAVMQASKRNKQISWVVGSNRQPPLEGESVDIILCLFGFFNNEGFYKILKPGGKVIMVDPGAEHLQELRQIIYPEVKKPAPLDLSQEVYANFSLTGSQVLQFKTTIYSNEQINHLLLMTPHFYRASKVGREVACKLESIKITIDVVFRVLKKL